MKKILIFGIVFIMCLGVVSAVDYNVGSGETYSVIQNAIDAASNGDRVVITDSATYSESINVNKSIILTSSASPTINGITTKYSTINITVNNVEVSNITIDSQTPSTSTTGSGEWRAGIYLNNNLNNITLQNLHITSITGQRGKDDSRDRNGGAAYGIYVYNNLTESLFYNLDIDSITGGRGNDKNGPVGNAGTGGTGYAINFNSNISNINVSYLDIDNIFGGDNGICESNYHDYCRDTYAGKVYGLNSNGNILNSKFKNINMYNIKGGSVTVQSIDISYEDWFSDAYGIYFASDDNYYNIFYNISINTVDTDKNNRIDDSGRQDGTKIIGAVLKSKYSNFSFIDVYNIGENNDGPPFGDSANVVGLQIIASNSGYINNINVENVYSRNPNTKTTGCIIENIETLGGSATGISITDYNNTNIKNISVSNIKGGSPQDTIIDTFCGAHRCYEFNGGNANGLGINGENLILDNISIYNIEGGSGANAKWGWENNGEGGLARGIANSVNNISFNNVDIDEVNSGDSGSGTQDVGNCGSKTYEDGYLYTGYSPTNIITNLSMSNIYAPGTWYSSDDYGIYLSPYTEQRVETGDIFNVTFYGSESMPGYKLWWDEDNIYENGNEHYISNSLTDSGSTTNPLSYYEWSVNMTESGYLLINFSNGDYVYSNEYLDLKYNFSGIIYNSSNNTLNNAIVIGFNVSGNNTFLNELSDINGQFDTLLKMGTYMFLSYNPSIESEGASGTTNTSTENYNNLNITLPGSYTVPQSDNITLVYNNFKPNMLQSYITPPNPNYRDDLNGYCQGEHPVNENITYYYQIYKNNILNKSGSTGVYNESETLYLVNVTDSTNTTIGDEWVLSCLASDGEYNSTWLNSTIYTILEKSVNYSNFEDSSTTFTPEIGDNINLSVNISTYGNVDTCYFQIYNESTLTWENKEEYNISTTTPYILNISYNITDWYNSTYQNVTWRTYCNDSIGNADYSNNQTFEVQDYTYPNINFGSNNMIGTNNRTIISSYLNNLTLQINFTDPNLFQAAVNITCGVNGSIYDWENISISGREYELNTTISLNDMTFQQCNMSIQVSDDHTKNKIPDYNVETLNNGLKFKTENDLNIEVLSNDIIKKSDTKKQKDRYNFDFEYDNTKLVRSYKLKTNGTLYQINDSNYPGHFVAWNSKTKTGNWIDFNFNGSENYNFVLNELNNNEYEIIILPKLNLDFIKINQTNEVNETEEIILPYKIKEKSKNINVKNTKEKKEKKDIIKEYIGVENEEEIPYYNEYKKLRGLNKIEFQSIGGVNIANATYSFYIGSAVNLSSINLYDNGTISNWTVNVTTLNAYPAWNGSATINGTWDWLENVSNGTYQLDFSHPTFFPKTYYLTVNNITQNLSYESFQAVHNVYIRNVKTLESLSNFNMTYDNLMSTYNKTSNTSGYLLTTYLNASTYNYTIEKSNYDNYTGQLSISALENLTETIDLSFIATFILYDERTLEIFDVNSADSINFLLFCPNSTYTTIITENTSSIPINCNYEKFKFVLNYGASSYYRNFILTPTEALNVSIYLINLNTTDYIYNSFILDDLLDDYDNPSIYVKKNIGSETIQITADETDIENKIGAYLIENNEYLLEVHSDNNPIRIMGTYSADIGGEKSLRLYDIDLNTEVAQYDEDLYVASNNVYNNDTNESEVQTIYSDTSGSTSEVTLTLYKDRLNGTVLYTSTVYNSSSIEFIWNSTDYQNSTIISFLEFTKDGKSDSYVKIVEDESKIQIPVIGHVSQNWLNWFFTLFLGMIAIMATMRTGNYVAMIVIAFASFFVYIGWYGLSWSSLGLALIVSLISMLKGAEKGK